MESKKQDDYETINAIIWNQKASKIIVNRSKSIKIAFSKLKNKENYYETIRTTNSESQTSKIIVE
jgi:hypothetical protein